jgi:SAM-dependent methyltransferase
MTAEHKERPHTDRTEEQFCMATLEPTGPNAEQIKYWNEISGPKWVALHQLIDTQIAPLGLRTIDRAGIQSGERVLDVGCGCGQTTVELARRVGPTGAVTGIDISTTMLQRAAARAREVGATQVRCENADAQTHRFAPDSFDLLFSRFGVMFFVDPAAAFANLRTALRPGGRLAFVCWQAVQQNPWMLVPLMAAAQHMTLPPMPGPDAPGPFAFANSERVRDILSRAGFTEIGFEAVDETLTVGGGAGLDETVEFLQHIGPAAAAMRDAPPEQRVAVAGAVREAVAPFLTPHGVRMPSAAWIVTARR